MGLDPVVVRRVCRRVRQPVPAGCHHSQPRRAGLVVGLLSRRVIAGVTATGHDVLVAGACCDSDSRHPGPRSATRSGGIQLSASHNPPQYNGLKFFQPRRHGTQPGTRAGRARPLAS